MLFENRSRLGDGLLSGSSVGLEKFSRMPGPFSSQPAATKTFGLSLKLSIDFPEFPRVDFYAFVTSSFDDPVSVQARNIRPATKTKITGGPSGMKNVLAKGRIRIGAIQIRARNDFS